MDFAFTPDTAKRSWALANAGWWRGLLTVFLNVQHGRPLSEGVDSEIADEITEELLLPALLKDQIVEKTGTGIITRYARLIFGNSEMKFKGNLVATLPSSVHSMMKEISQRDLLDACAVVSWVGISKSSDGVDQEFQKVFDSFRSFKQIPDSQVGENSADYEVVCLMVKKPRK